MGLLGRAVRRGIRAYHGSPHDFDRFSMAHIGKGEGAQAYGHGLYFAENEGVARSYRDALAGGIGDTTTPAGAADRALGIAGGNRDEAIAHLQRELSEIRRVTQEMGPRTPAVFAARVQEFEQAIELVRNGYNRGGRMYEVRINADPEDFLDWDAPLSGQSEGIRQRLNSVIGAPAADAQAFQLPSGRWALRRQDGTIIGRQDGWPTKGDAEYSAGVLDDRRPRSVESLVRDFSPSANHGEIIPSVSERLRDAGIPGIRYLDQGSRPNLGRVQMLEQTLVNLRARNAGPQAIRETERELAEARAALSNNYVVFDDALIEILRKYGIAGLTAGGGGLISAARQQQA